MEYRQLILGKQHYPLWTMHYVLSWPAHPLGLQAACLPRHAGRFNLYSDSVRIPADHSLIVNCTCLLDTIEKGNASQTSPLFIDSVYSYIPFSLLLYDLFGHLLCSGSNIHNIDIRSESRYI